MKRALSRSERVSSTHGSQRPRRLCPLQPRVDQGSESPRNLALVAREEFAQFLKQDLQKYVEIGRKAKIELQ